MQLAQLLYISCVQGVPMQSRPTHTQTHTQQSRDPGQEPTEAVGQVLDPQVCSQATQEIRE